MRTSGGCELRAFHVARPSRVQLICLFVAGALRAALPTSELTLAWTHSVEKTRWEEDYRVDGDGLRLVVARIQGSGAGMDPPPDAVLRDGYWTWHPYTAPFRELRLTLSSYVADYELCWRGRCATLRQLVAPRDDARSAVRDMRIASEVVAVRPCDGGTISLPRGGRE